MTDESATIRSYQRIFTPDRRLYSIEGHPIPVPGGVPLRWLGYASSVLVAVLALSAHSAGVALVAAAAAGLAGIGRGVLTAAVAAFAGFLSVELAGLIVGALDWPIRLIVIPVAVATLGTQATPDGRRAHRFALSWLALRLAPARQSLGRSLAERADAAESAAWSLWVCSDGRTPELVRGLVRGPATVRFSAPVESRRRRRRLRVGVLGARVRRGAVVRVVSLEPGEALEVRP